MLGFLFLFYFPALVEHPGDTLPDVLLRLTNRDYLFGLKNIEPRHLNLHYSWP